MSKESRTFEDAGLVEHGSIAELIFDGETGRTRFALCRDGKVSIVEEISVAGGDVLRPIPAHNNLLRHKVVRLPSGVGDYVSLAGLRADISAFIERHVALPERFLAIAVHYVVLSWVYDGFNELPYLRFRGDYGSGKTRALNVIGALLYKPLFASGATTISPIFHALDLFRGSLVLDEADFRFTDERAEISKILNNGNQRGYPVLRSMPTLQRTYDPRAFHVFGPKLLAMRGHFSDLAIESRCLTACMDEVRMGSAMPITLPPGFADEATKLRNQLLRFRFVTRPHLPFDTLPVVRDLSPRGNQMLGALLSLCDDEEARQQIVAQLQVEEASRKSARLEDSAALVLDALIAQMQGGKPHIAVSAVRHDLITRHGPEFERQPTARYVGSVLRTRFGLRTWKSHGTYLVAMPSSDTLDRLKARFGLG